VLARQRAAKVHRRCAVVHARVREAAMKKGWPPCGASLCFRNRGVVRLN
jgi:hypothetical protein